MATKTFSSRAAEDKVAFADALSQREYGMSYGKYCGTLLLDAICANRAFPELGTPKKSDKADALDFIKNFAKGQHDSAIAALSDAEIKDLIGQRYE